MDNSEEKFVAHPVGEEEAKPEKTKVKRVYKPRKPKVAADTVGKTKMVKIEKELKSIYEDTNGRIPNMKRIEKQKSHPVVKFFVSLLVIGACMSAAAWLGFMYFPQTKNIDSNSLDFQITGATDVTIGATTTYIFSWENKQNAKLENAILTVTYPDGFEYLSGTMEPKNAGKTEWDLGEIAAKGEGELKITGRNYGSLDQEKSWRVLVTYQAENMKSELQKTAVLKTKIVSSPISISAAGPDSIATGADARYVFAVKKTGDLPSDKLTLVPKLPANFSVSSSTPALDKSRIWTVNFVSSTASTTINELVYTLIGSFNGAAQDASSTAAEIGAVVDLSYGSDGRMFTLGETKIQTALIKSDQAFNVAINGAMTDFSARPDDSLNITVNLKNNGGASMKDVNVKIAFDAPAIGKTSALNWPEISDTLDSDIIGEQISDKVRRGTITWTSKHLPALAEVKPGQEINFDLRLPIRSTKDFDLASIGEYAIKSVSELTYKDANGAQKTLAGNPINITLNSNLALDVRDSINDENDHEISWVLTNDFHALKNLELSASLYGDISVTLGTAPAGEVKYDENEKKITWAIPEMPESVDTLALPFTVKINAKNPTQNTLVSKIRVKALDAVTNQTIEFMGDEVGV